MAVDNSRLSPVYPQRSCPFVWRLPCQLGFFLFEIDLCPSHFRLCLQLARQPPLGFLPSSCIKAAVFLFSLLSAAAALRAAWLPHPTGPCHRAEREREAGAAVARMAPAMEGISAAACTAPPRGKDFHCHCHCHQRRCLTSPLRPPRERITPAPRCRFQAAPPWHCFCVGKK